MISLAAHSKGLALKEMDLKCTEAQSKQWIAVSCMLHQSSATVTCTNTIHTVAWHTLKTFSNEQYCLVSPSFCHVNPLLGQKCFGINDLFVLTWNNWLYGRLLTMSSRIFFAAKSKEQAVFAFTQGRQSSPSHGQVFSLFPSHTPRTDPGVDA